MGAKEEVMSENKTEANSEKFKCKSCKHIWEDRSCVMEHFIGNIIIFFCLNCDDWVHDKQKVLEHGWTLFNICGVKFGVFSFGGHLSVHKFLGQK